MPPYIKVRWKSAMNVPMYLVVDKLISILEWAKLMEEYRQWHIPSPLLLTFRKTWIYIPVFVLKFFFNCYTKTNKLKWESDIKLVGSQCLWGAQWRCLSVSGMAVLPLLFFLMLTLCKLTREYLRPLQSNGRTSSLGGLVCLFVRLSFGRETLMHTVDQIWHEVRFYTAIKA